MDTPGQASRIARRVHDVPAALAVAARHLVRGSTHVSGVPQPWRRDPAYAAALAALQEGDLTGARALASAGSPMGRALAAYVDGELATLGGPEMDPAAARVVHLVGSSLPEVVAGYTLRTHGIARAQQRAGTDVHVVTRLGFPVTRGHLGSPRAVDVDGVSHHRLLPLRLPLRSDAALRVDIAHTTRLLGRLRPTVLHAHSNHLNGQVGLAVRDRLGIPLVYEVRGLLEETWLSRSGDPRAVASDFYRLTRAAETRVMRAADAVVTLSGALRDEVVRRGVPAARVRVVPNCVDATWLDTEPTPRGAGPLTVGQIGTLNSYEGLDVLIDAVALRRTAGSDVRLLVVGDGPARADLEKRAADRGIADVATFTGRLSPEGARAAYADLDVFCLPRHDLPVTRLVPPLKPLEAMARGTALVASDLPPLRELVGTDRGVLVPPGDPRALASALADLADPARRRAIGDAARTWVADTRTWASAAATYAAVYAELQPDHRGGTR